MRTRELMTRPLSFALAALLAAGLAACAAPSSGCPANPIAVTVPAPPKMVSPASGATGVPPSGTTLTISYDPPAGAVRLVAADGTTLAGGPIQPQGAPGGGATSALPTLAAHTTYTVFVDANYGSPACPVGLTGAQSYNIGTFTTQ